MPMLFAEELQVSLPFERKLVEEGVENFAFVQIVLQNTDHFGACLVFFRASLKLLHFTEPEMCERSLRVHF